MTPNNALEFVPIAFGSVTAGALVVAMVIFIRRARRWGFKWALRELIKSF